LKHYQKAFFLLFVCCSLIAPFALADKTEEYEPQYQDLFNPSGEEYGINANLGLQFFFQDPKNIPFFILDVQMGLMGPLTGGIGFGYYNDFGAGFNFEGWELYGSLNYYFKRRYKGPFVQGIGGVLIRETDAIVGTTKVVSSGTFATAGAYVGWQAFLYDEDFNINGALAVGAQGFYGAGKSSIVFGMILRLGSVFL